MIIVRVEFEGLDMNSWQLEMGIWSLKKIQVENIDL